MASKIKVDQIDTTLGTGNVTIDPDNNTLVVDTDNSRVGVAQSTPDAELHIGDGSGSSDNTRLRLTGGTSGYSTIQFGDTASANIGQIQYDHSGNFLAVRVNAAERVRFLSGGGITFNGDTATANALDDYEEGTYTPQLYSNGATFSYSVQLGSYIKIGNLVYLQFNITLSGVSGTTTNTVFIDNVPFNTKNIDNSLYSGGHIGHYFSVNLSAGTTMVYQIPAVSTNQIELKEVGDNIGENSIVASELQNGSVIRGSIMYRSV